IPNNIQELSKFSEELKEYSEKHPYHVFTIYCLTYIWKQTFAIPGSFLLNILGGALYGTINGLIITCILTATGATLCYLWSYYLARPYVIKFFSTRMETLSEKINNLNGSLFMTLISLRVMPMTPNWLLNITLPVLGIRLHYFTLSVLLGLMPYNLICVQSGRMLSEIHSSSDVITLSVMVKLLLATFLLLMPNILTIIFKKILSNKTKNECKKLL
ncbi:hypothetical protein HELRODRAFT_67244, partial [Helobdella robusta]|uniref:VTT domain-containing protein n=1 Tax=Helobdella robusta TaxID=6412 RepID=T1FYY8_HELRO